jgi:hypothetical protein
MRGKSDERIDIRDTTNEGQEMRYKRERERREKR